MADERSEKNRAVEGAIANIEKQFGKGSIMRLGEKRVVDVPAISTSCLSLDAAIGIGGVPRGRIVEIYGPESGGKTTLALHIVAQAQKQGGVAAYIDAEHALDAEYASKLGVKIDDLFVSQPDSGEQALEIAETLVRSNGIDVLVVDSVAALVPRAELDGEMGDSLPGLQARLMSQALRKLTAVVSRSKTCLVFINQIREKIGVMFGCFHYDARVVLADGTTEKIGNIVNQRLPVEVLSFNSETGAIEPRRVVNWFDNGPADYFLQFEIEGGPAGRRRFAATPNHMIFTPDGEIPAGDLRVGDEVLAVVDDYRLTDDQVQLLLGGVLGDGSLRPSGRHTAMFRVGHSPVREDYVRWKHLMLAPVSGNLCKVGNGIGFDTLSFPALAELEKEVYKDARPKRRVVPAKISRIYVKPPARATHKFDIEIEGNHTYMVDGVVVHNSPETTTGGRALKFYSSLRLDIRRTSTIKDGESAVGNRTKVKVVKNKLAPPFKEAEFDLMYGEGISREGDMLDLAVANKLVEKSGAWFSFQGERLGQGRENVKNLLKSDPSMTSRIESEVRRALGIPAPGTVEETDSNETPPTPTRRASAKE
jgi:recombination protein RecA